MQLYNFFPDDDLWVTHTIQHRPLKISAGFADQLKQDGETLKSLGNLAGKAGTWMYRNSAVNLLANPQDFLAAQQENRAMLETLADKAANMSAEEWGDFAGQVLFEVGTEVATAGGAAALTAVKVADKVVDVAKVANRVDDVLDTVKALDKLDDAADIAKATDKLDDAADAAKALDKAKVPIKVQEEELGMKLLKIGSKNY